MSDVLIAELAGVCMYVYTYLCVYVYTRRALCMSDVLIAELPDVCMYVDAFKYVTKCKNHDLEGGVLDVYLCMCAKM